MQWVCFCVFFVSVVWVGFLSLVVFKVVVASCFVLESLVLAFGVRLDLTRVLSS